MDYDSTYDEMNQTLDDSGDVTFTPERKARALQKAWKDSYVVKTVWDTTVTFDSNTYRYTVPTSMDTVKGIYISAGNSSDSFPQPIDAALWEVVDGYIQFKPQANNYIPDGYTLYIKGNYKYDYTADTLPTDTLQEYVIALGAYNTLTLLTYSKVNLFLKNDTTLSELIALKRELKQDVLELRGKLQREFQGV